RPHRSTPFPYTTLFRSSAAQQNPDVKAAEASVAQETSGVTSARSGLLPSVSFDYFYGIDANQFAIYNPDHQRLLGSAAQAQVTRSEEHTSELQSPCNLV